MTSIRKRKIAFILLAIAALAAVPCAWDASDPSGVLASGRRLDADRLIAASNRCRT